MSKAWNMLRAARSDYEFIESVKVHEPKEYVLLFSDEYRYKIFTVAMYMGYLIGKGKYKESDFERPFWKKQ